MKRVWKELYIYSREKTAGFHRSPRPPRHAEVFVCRDRCPERRGEILTMGAPDVYTTHLSFGNRGWTTMSTCTLDFPAKKTFKLERRQDRKSWGTEELGASRRGANWMGFEG